MSSTVKAAIARMLTGRQDRRITVANAEVAALLNEAAAAHRAGNRALAIVKAKEAMVHGMRKLRTELKDVESTRPGDAEDWYVWLALQMAKRMTQVHTNKAPKPAAQAGEVAADG
jgi:hypothetical protein